MKDMDKKRVQVKSSIIVVFGIAGSSRYCNTICGIT